MLDYQQSISGHINRLFSKRSSGSALTLRMAPLIDVIFLLLIFFFVSIGLSPAESFLPMALPNQPGSTAAIAVVEPLVISVSDIGRGCKISFAPGHSVTLHSSSIDTDMLVTAQTLREVMIKQKRTSADPVELVFDDGVKWDYTAKIYNLLFGLGIEDITFRLNE
ncbi:MAG: biopolymer transporter ExbD [Anaerohalosphaeraceae bacterium]|nr:biopolymer transporter ExbD [Anaerohalosphaeraceae bacterium]